jgi:RNA polymerase sigma factor (sigma-70 family)
MNPDQKSLSDGAERFRTTCWDAVLLSAQSQAPGSEAALAELCSLYWYPIYAFVRRRGHDPDKAKDLTQGFFLHLLDHKALRHVSPFKGKFRSFLIASLRNYLSDEVDRARSIKRGGNVEFVSLDTKSAEHRYRLEAPDFLTADKIFDARWALTLLDQAMSRLGRDYEARGRTSIFETLKPFLNPVNASVTLSYEQAANALHISVATVKTLIHRLRQRYTSILREEVARTVSDPSAVDEEIHALCEALIATEGRLGP